jgi:uncharacterized protein involved in exopolysaccharide biosynthesis
MNSNLSTTSDPFALPFNAIQIILRNKYKFAVTVLLGLALTVFFFANATRKFSSSAKLFVKMGRESVVLDPTARTSQVTSMGDSREEQVFAVAELMNSRLIAEKVVDYFGPDVIREKKADAQSLGERLAFLNQANLNIFRVYSERDKAVTAFQKNLGVLAGKRTNVVSLSYEAESPELAQSVLEFIVEVTMDDHIRIHRTRGSEDYFAGKVESSSNQLGLLELELRDFKTEAGLASLEKQRDSLLELIAELRMDLLRSQSQEKALMAGLKNRQAKLKEIPEMVLIQEQTGQAQAVGQSFREQLFQLEIEEKQLSSRYPAYHPSVQQIREQIANVRKIHDAEAVATAKTLGVNPVYSELETEMVKSQAALAEVQARITAVADDLEQAETRIASFNDADMKVTKFTRKIDMVREVVKTNMDMLEQAKIDNELEERRISSLNVMQPPTLVPTPSNPKPMLTFGLGGLLSLIAGLGVALLFNRSNETSTVPSANVSREQRQAPAARSDSESGANAQASKDRAEPVAVGGPADGLRVPR